MVVNYTTTQINTNMNKTAFETAWEAHKEAGVYSLILVIVLWILKLLKII